MNTEKKLAISGIAGVLVASLIITSITMAPFQPTQQPLEKRFLRAMVTFTDFLAVNLTIIEKYGGEVVYTFDPIPTVVAKIPRENITKLAEEDVIKNISYDGAILLYGVSEPTWNVTVETTYEQFKLTMRLEKTVFQLGEDVKVKFTLTNIGEQNVTVRFGAKRFSFAIYNSTGQIWSHPFRGGIPEYDLITLKPGENISDVPYQWEQTYKVHREYKEGVYSPKYDFLPVSPGTYHIIGKEFLSYPKTEIQTPPVEISIVQTQA